MIWCAVKLLGIHHITAIAGEPQRNVDFYTQVLGLRLVKRTVNFDDPGSYHFYFGDNTGSPGTIITFFPWAGARRGSRGNSLVTATSFAVQPEAMDFWSERLKNQRVSADLATKRFGGHVLRFADPDGLLLELIPSTDAKTVDLPMNSDVPAEFALRGFHAPTLQVANASPTTELLTQTLGFASENEEGNRQRFSLGAGAASTIDIIEKPDDGFGNNLAGTVHHIAFRCADDAEQAAWRAKIVDLGYRVSPVMDRQYFHSIYFREPNGILFEIATDGPGMTIDEPVESLGTALKLPPMYEMNRAEIEATLPRIYSRDDVR